MRKIKTRRQFLSTNSGQALLIIVLVLAVVLTIGLAVVSRSITDIKISRQEEESARVFSAAEAGIEEALKQNLALDAAPLTGSIGDIDYSVSATRLSTGREFVFSQPVDAGDIQTILLVGHSTDGSINTGESYSQNTIELYWGNEGTAADQASTPALEASIVYKQGADYKLARYALDPNLNRATTFGFTQANSGSYTVSSRNLQFFKDISVPAGAGTIPYMLRLRLIYNTSPHFLGIKGVNQNLPVQGKCYEAMAKRSTSGITRRPQHCQFFKAPPGIFDYVLFSEGNLEHQP